MSLSERGGVGKRGRGRPVGTGLSLHEQEPPAASLRPVRAQGEYWLRADDSTIHGRGVYARRVIPDGTHVAEYIGERITKAEARLRERQRIERQRRGDDGSVYIFELNRRYDLDGRCPGNVARLINHSCAPNCRTETKRGRVLIIARREISAGEELTFDYGFPFAEWPLHSTWRRVVGENGCLSVKFNCKRDVTSRI